jgi:hypothetical protein
MKGDLIAKHGGCFVMVEYFCDKLQLINE